MRELTPKDHLYYRALSARGKEVIKQKKAEGEVMHLAPLGYKNARDELGRSIIVPDPETYHLVQKAHELRAQGMSLRKICAEMERRGLRGQRGGVLGPSSLQHLLCIQKTLETQEYKHTKCNS